MHSSRRSNNSSRSSSAHNNNELTDGNAVSAISVWRLQWTIDDFDSFIASFLFLMQIVKCTFQDCAETLARLKRQTVAINS